ncbi:LptF/LptG family permease [Candidatus Kinetoplastidibacterium crithidiae]|uniref:Lipopolysaccharide export system permease protein n=1 Tax=Candidatus Kinetoplastidibacterium crithidiae TCC036E TaxID=1208918 RepID=M1LQM8_9PROT|nr:LptF/LptG family permease [Candidatus Kinetoplastibacterium crithidii]AFZ82902.1 lipopolysaccharide export system permease protein [Candidatus Kinetoplastibacterium crithidii (ex Angomonas deanei ATCC 30255)]AGF47902.1 lipopolysaccharide export system permease protein [Candidatus Kinetoplastibacterium crithidii TCC036E]
MILTLYIGKEVYKSTTIVLLFLIGLFIFFSFVEDINDLNDELTLIKIININLLKIPNYLYEILPIALLIGGTISIAKLSRNNEIVILKTSGISNLKLLKILWAITVPIILISIVLSEYIIPIAEIKNKELKLYIRTTNKDSLLSDYWFKETIDENKSRIINIKNIKNNTCICNIYIYEFSKDLDLLNLIIAEKGRFINNYLALDKVTIIKKTSDNNHKKYFSKDFLDCLKITTSLNYKTITYSTLNPDNMSMEMLMNYMNTTKNTQIDTRKQKAAFYRRVSSPITLFIMISIAIHLVIVQSRENKLNNKIFISITLGTIFFLINQLLLNVSLKNIPIYIWVTIPNIFCLTVLTTVLILNKK